MGFKDKKKQAEYNKMWRNNNIERSKEIGKRCYYKNKDNIRTVESKRLMSIRTQLFKVLGGAKCKFCNFSIWQGLQFDHKNGNGCSDRREFQSGRMMYKFYINNPELAVRELQVTCANCNFIKRHKQSEVN